MICEQCGHAKRLDMAGFQDNLKNQQRFFDSNAKRPEKRFARWPRRPALVASEVRRLTGKKGKTLDVGCGTGMWLAALGNGWQQYGVEISEKSASIARSFTNAEVYCGPIESYEAEEENFDLITAFALIEHLSEPRSFLEWAYEHLKTGGILVLMTGDRESKTALEMGESWPLYHCDEHVSFFSARSLTRLVEDVGFIVARKEWRFMYMPWGMGSPAFRLAQKLKEIMRLVTEPQHDHLYLYARKCQMPG
jgi:SAM-dependent methyltransferase